MKNICHGPLECHTGVLEAKRHDTIWKHTPWGSECSFVLVCGMNLNSIVARETIHEGQAFVADKIIDNLVDERHWEVFFGLGLIEITKVSADMNTTLFFVDRDGDVDPLSLLRVARPPGQDLLILEPKWLFWFRTGTLRTIT
jgi:hypothetical protein